MTINIRQKILFLFLVILAGNGFIGYAVYRSNQKLHDSEQWVQHTEQVIYQSGNILSLAKDIETGTRGFVITNDSAFLEPLNNAEKSIFVYIEQLRQLIKDNPEQQQRVDSLNFYMHRLLDFSFQSVELRSKNDLASAIAFTSTKQGKRYLDQVRGITNAIQQAEVSLLKQRKQRNDDSMAAFNRLLVIVFILMGIFTILLLIVTGKNLLQNEEKEKRSAELIVANKELAFQNVEKEKRAEELRIANKELVAFTYISSHDLQEPLRKIQTFVSRIAASESANLTDRGKDVFHRIQESAKRMQTLIEDLLAFSRVNTAERIFVNTDLNIIIEEVKTELKESIEEKHAVLEASELCQVNVIQFQFRQLMINLIGNSLKFSVPQIPPHIVIASKIETGSQLNNEKLSPEKKYCHITVTDNGIGFEPKFHDRIFEVFQKLHDKEEYPGTGIGLAIVKKIVENHNGIITATSELGKGARFDIYIPA
jgi:signal transduction histidine kinase